jgi:nucleotide-binding universal stress UspA family protein
MGDKRSHNNWLIYWVFIIKKIVATLLYMSENVNPKRLLVSVSQNKEPDTKSGFKHNVEGELLTAMEEKIKKCVEAGAKNKMSYEIKVGQAADQIVKACEETRYDLVVMTTFHLDSWLKSLFSEARKIISKINTPVLLVQ